MESLTKRDEIDPATPLATDGGEAEYGFQPESKETKLPTEQEFWAEQVQLPHRRVLLRGLSTGHCRLEVAVSANRAFETAGAGPTWTPMME